jgi:CHAT domain-containing protein
VDKIYRADHVLVSAFLELADTYLLADRPRDAKRVLAVVEPSIPGLLSWNRPDASARILLAKARLAHLEGQLDDAKDLLANAFKIMTRNLRVSSKRLLAYLREAGSVQLARGNSGAAEELYTAALQLQEQHLLKTTSLRREIATELAEAVAANGRYKDAIVQLLDACSQDQILWNIISVVSEAQRLRYLARLKRDIDMLLTWIEDGELSRAFGTSAFEVLLRRKGAGFEIDVAQQEAVFSERYPQLRSSLQQLSALRTRIGQKMLAGAGAEGIEGHEQVLALWRQQRQELEADLIRMIPVLDLATPLSVTISVIRQALPPASALIELYQYAHSVGQDRYVAFVMSNEHEACSVFWLGDADSLNALADNFRKLLDGSIPFPLRDQAAKRVHELAARLLPPINAARRRAKRLIIAADGHLNSIPFELLPVASSPGKQLTAASFGIPLSEELLIHYAEISYVTTGRDMCRLRRIGQPRALTRPLVVGAPDYNLNSDDQTTGAGEGPHRFDALDGTFDALDGTKKEATEVARMLKVEPLVGQAAVKSAVSNGPSPAILHLATHSYTFANTSSLTPVPEDPHNGIENYTLRTGLALAGANTWLRRGITTEDAGDGLLSANDVLGMDLQGTELVTLSACETGIGAVAAGEGTFGLRRSFLIAGAHSLIVSLWKVPDEATAELMHEFYQRLLHGESKMDSLRAAQDLVSMSRPHPFHWAAFVLIGDAGPLSPQTQASASEGWSAQNASSP